MVKESTKGSGAKLVERGEERDVWGGMSIIY